MCINILLIDDDVRFTRAIQLNLQDAYKVFGAIDLKESIDILTTKPISLILLDFVVGKDSGHSILDEIRKNNFLQPVIIISGAVDLSMTTGFLKRTVQGFFEKPFSGQDLKLKIKDLLENSTVQKKDNSNDRNEKTHFICVNPHNRSIKIDQKVIGLTKIEFEIFSLFFKKPFTKVTRTELISEIWGVTHHSKNNLDTHLLNLRKKLPKFSQHLELVYGEGYYFSPSKDWIGVGINSQINSTDYTL